MESYFFTDLAYETYDFLRDEQLRTREYRGGDRGELVFFEMQVETEAQEQRYRRPRGSYLTVLSSKIWRMDEEMFASLSKALTNALWQRLQPFLGDDAEQSSIVLVAGLGNPAFTVDAVGPRTVSLLNVTRHIEKDVSSKAIALAAIATGVPADTGMEAVEQIRGVSEAIGARAVIAVDALAAGDFSRLGATVQIADTGICPGSGVGNARKAITKETVGVPVIAVGVPTVVDSATMLTDALRRGGIVEPSSRMTRVIQGYRGAYVCPKESDWITQSISMLLASAIERLGGIERGARAYSEA